MPRAVVLASGVGAKAPLGGASRRDRDQGRARARSIECVVGRGEGAPCSGLSNQTAARKDRADGRLKLVRRLLVSAVFAALSLALVGLAHADELPTLSGTWSASALSERWVIGDWGEACGPKPQPQGAAGGSVQIRQQGGELSISGAGRPWTTAQCWEQMPGLARTNHSGGQRGWSTRCSTQANDPRRATIVTTTQATDTTITMTEMGQYQFVIQQQACTASVTRSRSFQLVKREGDAPVAAKPPATAEPAPSAAAVVAPPTPAPTPAPSPAPEKPCANLGEPARLEVLPSRKLLRSGERFGFRAVVLDAAGCRLATRPSWSLAPGPVAAKSSVDASGVVTVADDAPEGKASLIASLRDKSVTVMLEVTTPENYDALLATSGLNAAGEAEGGAVAMIATGTIGGTETSAIGSARERKRLFLFIVGGVAAALAMGGLVLRRRGSRPASAPEEDALADEPAPSPTAHQASATAAVPQQAKGKICPSCGQRYSAESVFCGRDGTSLVRLN